jgi:hypothetical protein
VTLQELESDIVKLALDPVLRADFLKAVAEVKAAFADLRQLAVDLHAAPAA